MKKKLNENQKTKEKPTAKKKNETKDKKKEN